MEAGRGIKARLADDPTPPADSRHVERIGRFEIIEVLGRGSYGTVLRVRDLKLGCERAMKLPNPDTLGSPSMPARFMDEARKAARIDHPNVVRVMEADEVLSLYYIVMEYCSEGSLSAQRPPPGRPAGPAPLGGRARLRDRRRRPPGSCSRTPPPRSQARQRHAGTRRRS